ncbi:MAG: hypothetical protein HXX08_14285 [Chloroflexi bacterium]|nr:hypothetical protein [Chloroflexota bacterium]
MSEEREPYIAPKLSLKEGAAASLVRPEAVVGQLLFLENEQAVFGYRNRQGVELWKYLSTETLRQAFSQLPVDTGWLPPGLVRWGILAGQEWAVQFIPPGTHSLILLEGVQAIERRLKVPLPGLVLAGSGTNYYVWATKSRGFDPAGKLYLAPLPNLGGNGLVCYGSNRVPETSTGTIGEAWNMFIQTPFNEHQANNKCRRHPEDVRQLLYRLEGCSKFPVRELIGYSGREGQQVTVAQAVEKLVLKEA